jgi:hypothetical protein
VAVDSAIAALAQETFRRRVELAPAPTLLLGVDFAGAAGIPSLSELAAAHGSAIAGTERVDAFRGWLERAAPVERAITAAQLTGTIPVPQFAQEMALLARDGFFDAIVTRSFDALPERALEMTGLVDEEDYRIVDLVDDDWDGSDIADLTVIKAYGKTIPRTPPLQSALAGMVIAVGAGDSDSALANALADGGGPLWWVDRHQPPPRDRDAYERARDLRLVVGPAGDPDRFFGELSLLLQQIPSINLAKMPHQAGDRPPALPKDRASRLGPGRHSRSVVAALGSIGGVYPEHEAPDEFERLLLRTRMQRCRDAIRRLRRRGGGMSIDEGVDRQLAYELQLLDLLEIQHRTLEPSKKAMLELLGAIRDASMDSGDPETTAFLDTLVATIDDEFHRPEPNQHIVGTTLGAVANLAQRVGVSPTLVTQLSAYALNTKQGPL